MSTLRIQLLGEEVNSLTDKVIGCAFTVSNSLGAGFLEKVYENALAHELKKNGLKVSQQQSIPVYYDGVLVGDYYADIIVENTVLVELKVVRRLDEIHMAQCLNYLRATGMPVCLLMNFAKPTLEFHRYINTF